MESSTNDEEIMILKEEVLFNDACDGLLGNG